MFSTEHGAQVVGRLMNIRQAKGAQENPPACRKELHTNALSFSSWSQQHCR